MWQALLDFFNWKKYPQNVFFLAVPLAALAFTLMLHVAILHIRINGDRVYLYEWIAGVVLLIIALIPPIRGLIRHEAV